jgi:hypothetical protein
MKSPLNALAIAPGRSVLVHSQPGQHQQIYRASRKEETAQPWPYRSERLLSSSVTPIQAPRRVKRCHDRGLQQVILACPCVGTLGAQTDGIHGSATDSPGK